MNDAKYKYTLYLILIVIIATIGIQIFWNYKNYLANKAQLYTDVQTTLDKAVDDYYTAIAHETTLGLKIENNQEHIFKENGILERITESIDSNNSTLKGIDSLRIDAFEGVTILRGVAADSFMKQDKTNQKKWVKNTTEETFDSITNNQDSLKIKLSNFEILTSKVIISISNDTLNLNTIDSLIVKDLLEKKIPVDFYLEFKPNTRDSLFSPKQIVKYDKANELDSSHLIAVSKSKLLPPESALIMNFENETWLIFKRSLSGILISTILVLSVIGCLFYLLKIIKHQKQLSEVKNDLISNITHEFKTPIATIGVALESLQNFNAIDDKEKSKSYLEMSSTQLSKLNTMVEKLLETATLDSESLELNKERYNISEVVRSITEKHKLQSDKLVSYTIEDNVYATVDIFHFENAINNIIDNAFKYGGDAIEVHLTAKSSKIELIVTDNGTSLTKAHKDRIFEKFYRVPKGNTHDVKGFGIGLYYTKKIIEKHQGLLQLDLSKTQTSFIIHLPYV